MFSLEIIRRAESQSDDLNRSQIHSNRRRNSQLNPGKFSLFKHPDQDGSHQKEEPQKDLILGFGTALTDTTTHDGSAAGSLKIEFVFVDIIIRNAHGVDIGRSRRLVVDQTESKFD